MKTIISALVLAAGTFSASAALADPVSWSGWASANDNGGLGGSFAFLNSGGTDPLTLSDPWTIGWTQSDVIFNASFDGGTYTNQGSWDGGSAIYSFGSPDTTTYGETFYAASGVLTGFDFLIDNQGPGNEANFVVAAFDGSKAVGPALYTSAVKLGGPGYTWTAIDPFKLELNKGQQYIAYLTTAGVSATPAVPEPATWAMMITGFGMTGAALRRRQTVKVAFAA